jgi:hypothetical protein
MTHTGSPGSRSQKTSQHNEEELVGRQSLVCCVWCLMRFPVQLYKLIYCNLSPNLKHRTKVSIPNTTYQAVHNLLVHVQHPAIAPTTHSLTTAQNNTYQAVHDLLVHVQHVIIQALWGLRGGHCPTPRLLQLIAVLHTQTCSQGEFVMTMHMSVTARCLDSLSLLLYCTHKYGFRTCSQ